MSGGFLDQSIEQLNDVTAVSGVNLRVIPPSMPDSGMYLVLVTSCLKNIQKYFQVV